MRFILLFILTIISFGLQAQDSESAKKKLVNKFTNGISAALENFIGSEGDTEVQITSGEEYHPEFSIMTVRPLATSWHRINGCFC